MVFYPYEKLEDYVTVYSRFVDSVRGDLTNLRPGLVSFVSVSEHAG